MTCSMAKELKPGLMGPDMKEIMLLEGSTELALINGMTGHSTLETGRKIKSQALVFTAGWMAGSTKESGRIIIWKASVFISGTMAGNTKVNIKMIRSMALECMPGLMAGATKAIGTRASSMVSVHTWCPRRTR